MKSKFSFKWEQPAISNLLVNARYTLTDIEGRVFLSLLKNIKWDDESFNEIKYAENAILDVTGIRRENLPYLKDCLSTFFEKKLFIGDFARKHSYRERRWIDVNEWDEETGTVTLKLADGLKPHLLDLLIGGNYTQVEIADMVQMTPHTRRIYMFIKQKLRMREKRMPISDMIESMELPTTYRDYKYLNRDILKPAQKQINKLNDIRVAILPDKKNKFPGGKYKNLVFEVTTKKGETFHTQKDRVQQGITRQTLNNGEVVFGKDEMHVLKKVA